MLGFCLWFGLWLWLGLWLGSEWSVRVLIFPPEPSKECVKVSHVIFEYRVINHHPNSDIIAFAFLFDAIICRIKIHFLVIMTSSDSVSNQSGWLGEVSLHEQCRVDFTKMHPQRAPKSMFSCRSILFHL